VVTISPHQENKAKEKAEKKENTTADKEKGQDKDESSEEDLISIQPKTQNPRTINMTPTQGRLLFFVSVIILPLLVLVIGVSIWIRRRTL